ncbi:Nickel-dependent hydrogenase, large subunit [Candidatus Terasakiella magnetica]|uniref:Nickel-dependent hydrogenase, large subunit n=1 Tax=Candidatus Terasakiella magnetica TaxID=1867952 RepID=A0A1C3RLU4_9PROT|nr:nickel-dependent hydrogenase large subunit [Candidatus Terasakiella magnetica]SCA58257.1 Nickel-dependent hydrogenase, large subunit [Candidatus Terasakiella magnetica]
MSRRIAIDLNRVEGDLELDVEIQDGRVVDAWCKGVLYRGFEQILIGRDALDPLAITPRICGICGTAHLYTAVLALENAFNISVPDNGKRIRNVCLLAEEILSDCRQTFLMFTPDLCHEKYAGVEGFDQVVSEFKEISGQAYRDAVKQSKKIVEIVAIFGGQWPHSSYMVPGGVTTPVNTRNLHDALNVLDGYTNWFEKRVIGDDLENWMAMDKAADYLQWCEENPDNIASLFTRFGRLLGLQDYAQGSQNHLSYGYLPDGENNSLLRTGGYIRQGDVDNQQSFDHLKITEDLSHAWFNDELAKPLHPYDGVTQPNYSEGGKAYSWAKAPRYDDQVVQTGALSSLLNSGDGLMRDFAKAEGSNAWLRQFARIRRQAGSLLMVRKLLNDLLAHEHQPFIENQPLGQDGEGFGTIEAARGCLGHWVKIRDGKIAHYQVVTPTAWNASPRDAQERRGHWEESLIGVPIADENDPLEIGHVIRSHDPCLVCTVHVMGNDKRLWFGK